MMTTTTAANVADKEPMGTTSSKQETEGILCSPSVSRFEGNIIYFIVVSVIIFSLI